MSNSTNTIKDKVSIVGIGESAYYKRGQSPYPEFQLALQPFWRRARIRGWTRSKLTVSLPTPTTATIR